MQERAKEQERRSQKDRWEVLFTDVSSYYRPNGYSMSSVSLGPLRGRKEVRVVPARYKTICSYTLCFLKKRDVGRVERRGCVFKQWTRSVLADYSFPPSNLCYLPQSYLCASYIFCSYCFVICICLCGCVCVCVWMWVCGYVGFSTLNNSSGGIWFPSL